MGTEDSVWREWVNTPEFEERERQLSGQTVEMPGGIKAKILSRADSENVDAVVCGPKSFYVDDVHTYCAACACVGRLTPIVHRPHAPKAPPNICMDCAAKHQGSAKPEWRTVQLPPVLEAPRPGELPS
jgi:hypothetical protein